MSTAVPSRWRKMLIVNRLADLMSKVHVQES